MAYVIFVLSIVVSSTITSAQPSLYFGIRDVNDLRRKAVTTHRNIDMLLEESVRTMLADQIYYLPPSTNEQFTRPSFLIERYGNNLAPLAFYCLLHPENERALEFSLLYMDRLCKLTSWYATDTPDSVLPVSHTLTGFASAYDFLYIYLDENRRQDYLQRILNETEVFYKQSMYRWWGHSYLQNHVVTIYVSILHGALVLKEQNVTTSMAWLDRAIAQLEKTMFLLNQVVDGSLTEGVHYTSYTSRSLTQYAYLARRHWEINHMGDVWFRNHFWYYYCTVFPGFQRTIGVADAHFDWGYGPESQLRFLDTYVMRTGYGNWLANHIRGNRKTGMYEAVSEATSSEKWCTLHTEFLWYNSSLIAKSPSQYKQPHLHVFNDWGVVTYTDAGPGISNHYPTFLAFKSGKMHGQAVFDVVNQGMYKTWVRGWSSFNPGHEHPDQNMLIFAPNGKLFITDSLYSPKYSFLNNVLMFSVAGDKNVNSCLGPWVGQLGECSKWLTWNEPNVRNNGGEIITAKLTAKGLHISGEAVDSYDSTLGLKSVYRNILLINSDLLLVLDHVELKDYSNVKMCSAYFHNKDNPFHETIRENSDDFLQANAQVTIDNERYNVYWQADSEKQEYQLQSKQYWSAYTNRSTNFVNITFSLRKKTRIVYAFSSPKLKVQNLEFLELREDSVDILLRTDKATHKATVVTTYNNPLIRARELGFPGYASLKSMKQYTLGKNSDRKTGTYIKDSYSKTLQKRNMDDDSSGMEPTITRTIKYALLVGGVIALIRKLNLKRKGIYGARFTNRNFLMFNYLLCAILMAVLFVIYVHMSQYHEPIMSYQRVLQSRTENRSDTRAATITSLSLLKQLQKIIITALPFSGTEVVSQMFIHNPDFVYMQLLTDDYVNHRQSIKNDSLHSPRKSAVKDDLLASWLTQVLEHKTVIADRCNESLTQVTTSKRFPRGQVYETPPLKYLREILNSSFLSAKDKNYRTYDRDMLCRHAEKFPNALQVINYDDANWTMWMSRLHDRFGSSLRVVYIVCDPRNWVVNVRALFQYRNLASLRQIYLSGFNIQSSDMLQKMATEPDFHKILARLWLSYTLKALQYFQNVKTENIEIISWEEIIRRPSTIIKRVYNFTGMPLPPSMEHQLLQATRSGVFQVPYIGVIDENSIYRWQDNLTKSEASDVWKICTKAVDRLKTLKFVFEKK
ncbi:dermatan-sulfate epimerase-like protein [Glandiceps talaboti]